jgi:hypothetical protein
MMFFTSTDKPFSPSSTASTSLTENKQNKIQYTLHKTTTTAGVSNQTMTILFSGAMEFHEMTTEMMMELNKTHVFA